MDETLIQDAENDVDHHDGHEQQDSHVLDGRLEDLSGALEICRQGRRQVKIHQGLVDCIDRGAKRNIWSQVEGNRNRRQLAKVIDSQRANTTTDFSYGPQGNQSSAARTNEEIGQGRRVALILGQQFHNNPVLIHRRINGGDLPLAVGIVQRVFDLIGRHAQRIRFVAIDVYQHLRAGDEKICGYILKAAQLGHAILDDRCPVIELLQVRSLERKLVKALAEKPAGANQRRILEKSADAGNGQEFLPKLLDDLIDVRPLRARFEMHENTATVAADGRATGADGRHITHDIGIFIDDFHQGQLMLFHGFKRDVLTAFGNRKSLAGVLAREKALGDDAKKVNRHNDDQK